MKEEDIRPASLMIEKQNYLNWDVDFLLSMKADWVDVDCPACGSKENYVYGEKNGFRYVECKECETVFTNPRPSLDALHAFYMQSKNYDYWNKYIFPQTEQVRRRNIFRPRADKVVDFIKKQGLKGGVLIEVGAAYGWFCEEISAHNIFERIIAVEPTPGLASTCRRKGFETYELPIEKLELGRIADVIASFEVIEHLFSPRDFIVQCAELLKPSGWLVLSCPNVKGFDVGTLRENSATFDHEHLNYFHTQSLPLLLENCGFKTVFIETPGKLDVDILKKYVLERKVNISSNFFLSELLLKGSNLQLQNFQNFLSRNMLSSHMWVIAQKY